MSTDPYLPPQSFVTDGATPESPDLSEKISLTEFEAFTGRGRYPVRIKRYVDRESRHAGFNYWAMLFGTHWFMFRKLYLSAVAAFALEIGIPLPLVYLLRNYQLLDREHAVMVVLGAFVLARIVIGAFANIALAWKAEEVIRRVDRLNLDNSAHLKQISQSGGVSVIALIFAYLAMGLFQIATRG